MNPHSHRTCSITQLRKDAAGLTDWVRHTGGHLWIAKHGRLIAGIVPMGDCEKLETWRNRSLAEERRRMEESYARWKRVKALSQNGDRWDWDKAMYGAERYCTSRKT